jgi:hypothetical protein
VIKWGLIWQIWKFKVAWMTATNTFGDFAVGCGMDGAQFCLLLPCIHRWKWDHWRAGMGVVGHVAQSNIGLYTWPLGGTDKLHKHPYFKPHFPEFPILDTTSSLLQVVWLKAASMSILLNPCLWLLLYYTWRFQHTLICHFVNFLPDFLNWHWIRFYLGHFLHLLSLFYLKYNHFAAFVRVLPLSMSASVSWYMLLGDWMCLQQSHH